MNAVRKPAYKRRECTGNHGHRNEHEGRLLSIHVLNILQK